MYRKYLNFNSLPAIIQEMIEENSSAAAIIDELLDLKGETNTIAALIILDDMNIRGVQITNLYKICEQDIDKFYEKILTMTKEDIENINLESFAVCKYKAIYDGSKEDREKNPEKYIFTDEERNNIRNIKSKDHALDILENKVKPKIKDLYPSIKSDEALKIINKNGFICGYKKTYENIDGKNIIYRVFYNDQGDIMYTHSLENPDIFLWGESKLNVVRQSLDKEYELIGCNAYKNVKGVVGYNIELRNRPFETYKKVLSKGENKIEKIKYKYYNNNLIPIIESLEGMKYRQENKDYKGLVISNIYNLLTFPETYYDIDDELKHIYKILLPYSEDKAYDELIYQLNTDEGIDIALKLQNILGTKLDKDKLYEAKNRFLRTNKKHFNIPKPRFLSDQVIDDPLGNEINKRITKILSENNTVTE